MRAPARLARCTEGAYVSAMAKLGPGTIALIAALFAMLLGAGWFAARAWIAVEGPPMPATGYVAMALGVVFSLVLGIGLMALLFYSSRHGYDEASQEPFHGRLYEQQQTDDDWE